LTVREVAEMSGVDERPFPFTVRPAVVGDAGTIVSLSLLLARTRGETSPDPELFRLGVEAALTDEHLHCRYFLARAGSLPVGQVLVTAVWDDQANAEGWWVRRLFVAEAWRNRGVAKALLDHVHREAAAARNVPWVRAHVLEGNAPSRRLFERCGFRRSAVEYSRPVIAPNRCEEGKGWCHERPPDCTHARSVRAST
jgi:GNAT superfamily N-acetyltransferase